MSKWPSPPDYGLVRLRLPVTPSVRAAIGHGQAGLRCTGMGLDPETSATLAYDGGVEWEADLYGLQVYLGHPACRRPAGRRRPLSGQWLVFDWEKRRAWTGSNRQARRFLQDCWLALFADEDIPEQAERELRAAAENIADQFLAQPEALRASLDAYRPPSPLKWHDRLRLELDLVLRLS